MLVRLKSVRLRNLHVVTSLIKKTTTPFLKWVGGKRWLVEQYSEMLPISYNRYIEPFLGSGAVFFHLKPERALLSDLNRELIECYQQMRADPQGLSALLAEHQGKHCKEYYYGVRANIPATPSKRAARFLYLNRTCWNGLYRVNLKGQFNVPIGTKTNVLLTTDDFQETSSLLEHADITHSDFEDTLNKAIEGDFVYIDPPYTVKHNYNGFLKYNESIFRWKDQERLHAAAVRAKQRGATVVISNAAHVSLYELYKNSKTILTINRSSVLAASSAKRGQVEEILVRL